MALTPTERKRRQIAREREALKASLDLSYRHISRPFCAHFQEDADLANFTLPLDIAGIPAPKFDDDSGPEEHVLDGATDGVEDPFPGYAHSLGRAEVMVGCLLDAAVALATEINNFKRTELMSKLRQVEGVDLSNAENRKAAIEDLVEIRRLLDSLQKTVRWSVPQWELKGT